jgi:hypothetical protein
MNQAIRLVALRASVIASRLQSSRTRQELRVFGGTLIAAVLVISLIILALPKEALDSALPPGQEPELPVKPRRAPTQAPVLQAQVVAKTNSRPRRPAKTVEASPGQDFLAPPGPVAIGVMLVMGLMGAVIGLFGGGVLGLSVLALSFGHRPSGNPEPFPLVFLLGGGALGMLAGVFSSSLVARAVQAGRAKTKEPPQAPEVKVRVRPKE